MESGCDEVVRYTETLVLVQQTLIPLVILNSHLLLGHCGCGVVMYSVMFPCSCVLCSSLCFMSSLLLFLPAPVPVS